jgi:hypothetical protein
MVLGTGGRPTLRGVGPAGNRLHLDVVRLLRPRRALSRAPEQPYLEDQNLFR